MISKEELAAYLEERDRRLYGRLLVNRFFQGVVMAVDTTTTPDQVQVQRIGETTVDGAWYAVLATGYTPVVGDRVELVWRDEKVAYVLGKIS